MSRRFKAIVFDFDGLIVDTEVLVYRSWRDTFRSYGVDLPLPVWTPHIGRSHDSFDIYAYLLEHADGERASGPINRDEVRRESMATFDVLFEDAAPLPGVEDYINCARELELRIGIASSSTRSWVSPKLDSVGLGQAFDTVVCSDDVGKAKPDPASYLKAISDLGVTAEEAFALEDSPNGVQGAKNAGLLCVAVPGALTIDRSFDHADMRIESLEELPLPELMKALT